MKKIPTLFKRDPDNPKRWAGTWKPSDLRRVGLDEVGSSREPPH